MDSVRIDKWLWAARFFKTRSLAAQAVDNGKVKLDHERVKPARVLKIGECLQIDNGATIWEVSVQALSDVRRGADIAQKLYAETEQGLRQRQQQNQQRKYFKEPSLSIKGRPTKRDRRLLDKSDQ